MPKPRAEAISRIPFRHNAKAGLGFEIFKLSSLYDRSDRRLLGQHPLEAPQRPEFHIVYLGIRGKGELMVDFTPVPIGEGYLTFVSRGRVQQHVINRSIDAWMLMFSPEFLEIPGTGDPLVMPSVLWPLQHAPALQLAPGDHAQILSVVELLEAEHAREPDAYQPAILTSLLRVVLLHAERISAWQAPVSTLGRFFTILERDHAATRSVAHYARQSGISVRRLAELLRAELGRTTKEVIDDRVILEQRRLLAHTGITVKELASRTGFEEPTNLVKFFKHHTGQTPLEFRADVTVPRRRILPSRRRS